jgi:hypothetical protein
MRSEGVNESGMTICNAEFRFGTTERMRAESEFGVTRAGIRITSQALTVGAVILEPALAHSLSIAMPGYFWKAPFAGMTRLSRS